MVHLDTPAPDFSLNKALGGIVSLGDFNDKKVLVVMFICNHCPYVKHIKQGLIDIYLDYKDKGVGFVAINSNDPDYDSTDSPDYMKLENYPFPYAFDESQQTAKDFGAVCTPDIFVYNSKRKLAYRGQFDNSRPGNNYPVTGESLRSAIDALLEDKPVTLEQKPSTGCNIKWKPGNEPR